MLGGVVVVGIYDVGMVSDTFSSLVFTVLAIIVNATGAIVVGFPILFLPLPLAVACFLTKKTLSSYAAFVVLGSLMVAWSVMHNYRDLNIWITGLSLRSFCKLIVGSVILAMAIPGLAVLPQKFCFLSEEDAMYPSYTVVMTTFMGLAIVRKYFIHNHFSFRVLYREDPHTNSARIDGFVVSPISIKHEYNEWDLKDLRVTSCNQNSPDILFTVFFVLNALVWRAYLNVGFFALYLFLSFLS